MSETTIRVLGEGDWEQYKSFRLRALQESPEAFVANYETEVEYDEELWRARMRRASRLVAVQDGEVVGIASLRPNDTLFEKAAELFGLWVVPKLRGAGVAAKLVQEAANAASAAERTQLLYWVGTDNGRAVAFASSYGFRPTEYRRPMAIKGAEDEGDEEIAMVLALQR